MNNEKLRPSENRKPLPTVEETFFRLPDDQSKELMQKIVDKPEAADILRKAVLPFIDRHAVGVFAQNWAQVGNDQRNIIDIRVLLESAFEVYLPTFFLGFPRPTEEVKGFKLAEVQESWDCVQKKMPRAEDGDRLMRYFDKNYRKYGQQPEAMMRNQLLDRILENGTRNGAVTPMENDIIRRLAKDIVSSMINDSLQALRTRTEEK